VGLSYKLDHLQYYIVSEFTMLIYLSACCRVNLFEGMVIEGLFISDMLNMLFTTAVGKLESGTHLRRLEVPRPWTQEVKIP
jgi:hypothetical protein